MRPRASSASPRPTRCGFDFNPTVDRIRIVSNQRQNLRANPNTGTVDGDGDLAYAAGDPGAGTVPKVGAAAYTNSFRGAGSTTLFGIDTERDTLVRIEPPNDGVLNTVGELGIDASDQASFDIVADARERFSRDRALAVRVSASEAAAITVRLVIGGRTYARERGEVLGSAGSVVIRARLGRSGRQLVQRSGPRDVRLEVGARDASGKVGRATTRTVSVR